MATGERESPISSTARRIVVLVSCSGAVYRGLLFVGVVIGRNRILTVGIPRQKIRVQICKLFRNIQTHAIGNGKEIGGILVVVFQRIHGGAHHVFDIAAVSAKRSCQRHIRFRNVLIEISTVQNVARGENSFHYIAAANGQSG